ncbi:hypothetical protein MN116_004570 [Schistosoma mekongi]|uniref:G-protein coupled receptors family 1 profile domain-containing protein n=1 Tax=Schistosoma mekongi TaxID=38744 RepID=A0AAE1ZC69_SCHME|nr:hypothetical protein MN116_004570 [Schistosoma mekongi]
MTLDIFNVSLLSLNKSLSDDKEECSIHVKNMEYAVGFLRGYISPIIVILGVFGNMAAFYLFLTHRPWNRFSIYVMILAISDSLVLISNTFLDDFLGRGLYYLTNKSIMIKLDTYSLFSCQFMELVGTWFVFNSGCLLVAFSIDRVNCLYWPLKCRSNGGVSMATFICIFIIVIGLILSIPYAMLQTLIDKNAVLSNKTISSILINNTITVTTTTIIDNNSSKANNKIIGNNVYQSSSCPQCIRDNHEEAIENSSPSLTCALSTYGNQMDNKDLLSFLFSTVLTYMVPCILLVFINTIILLKLISIKAKRRSLCKTRNTSEQFMHWRNGADHMSITQIDSTINPITPPPPPTTTTGLTTLTGNTLTSTMASVLRRRRHTITEDRKELGRIVVLLLLSFFYLCFTFPVSISLTIRANLNNQHTKCLHLLYAHLSRLLTSIKDINYALNGYTYALFFQFYRTRLLNILTCSHHNRHHHHHHRRQQQQQHQQEQQHQHKENKNKLNYPEQCSSIILKNYFTNKQELSDSI